MERSYKTELNLGLVNVQKLGFWLWGISENGHFFDAKAEDHMALNR